jgi:4,5-DOPA dioxygenase extradiol
LQRLEWNGGEPKNWALGFDEWLGEQLETWNKDALFDYESRAPHVHDAVPTTEHFVPLLLSFGAADDSHKAKLLHRSYQLRSLSLSCWMFG